MQVTEETFLDCQGVQELQGRLVLSEHLNKATELSSAATSGIPPFLFRAFSVEDSRGTNNTTEMRPDKSQQFPRQSLFSCPRETVSSMLRAHLLWEYGNRSNFISWSSSLLWVLEHAARMHNYERKTNVHIAIMDTRKIHDMAIFPTTVLMKVYNIPKDDDEKKSKLNPRYPISEYLFYGPIRNSPNDPCYRAVHWDSLYNADTCGSLKSFWSRDIRDAQLHFRIERERLRRESQQSDFASIFPTIVLISALFGREFQVTMIIAFLRLLCGPLTPSADEFGLKLSYLQLPRLFDLDSIIDFNFTTNVDLTLLEVARFYKGLKIVLEDSLYKKRELIENFSRLLIIG